MTNLYDGTTRPRDKTARAYCEGRRLAATSGTPGYGVTTTGTEVADNGLTWTAKDLGTLTIDIVDPGVEDAELSVTTQSRHVTVSLATDANGDITTTAGDVATAIGAGNAEVAVAAIGASDGTGLMAATQVRAVGTQMSEDDATRFLAGFTSWSANPSGVARDDCANAYGGGYS